MFDRSSRPSSVSPNQRSVAPVRSQSSCHGTMLEWCSISVMTTSSPGPDLALPRPGQGVRGEVERLGGVLGEDHLVAVGRAEERRHLVARVLVRRGRLGAELVHGAGDVGVVPLEVVDHRVDDHLRLLRGVGASRGRPAADRRRARATRIGKSLRTTSRSGSRPARRRRIMAQTAALDVLVVALGLELPRRARGRPARRSGRRRRRARSRARCSAGCGCSG